MSEASSPQTLDELHRALAETRDALQLAMAALRTHPDKLRLFLGSALASVSAIRATLRMPAHDQDALHEKLHRLQTSVVQLGEEARAVQMEPVLLACQRLNGRIAALLQHEVISGDAILPLAVLVDQVASMIGNAWRTEEQRYREPRRTGRRASRTRKSDQTRAGNDWARASERRWSGFLRRHGEESGTLARLHFDGAQRVPAGLRRHVDELLHHLLHNALEHGIETPEERLAAQKPAAGVVSVKFDDKGGALRMVVHDDGRGFDVERIGRAAVHCGLVSEESLLEREAVDIVGLIFKPAFTVEGLDGETGHGRGMSFLRKTVTRLGGQIAVATKPGRYTQFTLLLPAAAEQVQADAAGGLRHGESLAIG